MDTPDRAAGLADPTLADALNKEWLLTSGRSSQLSGRYRVGRNANWSVSNSWSINSSSNIYGATPSNVSWSHRFRNFPTSSRVGGTESSWLLRNYLPHIRQESKPPDDIANNCSINNHLYDNINFVASTDWPKISSSTVNSIPLNADQFGDEDDQPNGCSFGKFRILLSCYLLLGITLAIYSRNALSLAIVAMVANNEINSQLVDILAAHKNITAVHNSTIISKIEKTLDGSCPVSYSSGTGLVNFKPMISSPLISEPIPKYQDVDKMQVEAAYRASIRQRVEQGELVDWSPGEQGLIFAAGSVGNLLIAIPITRMGEIYGAKWVIFAALFGATIQAAFMPLISPCHISLVIIFQIIFCGLTFGADCVAYTFFAHWLTPVEMAFFVSCLLICYQLGNIISSFVTASILTRGLDWSWCFYVPAILCSIWTIIWAIIGASEPINSTFISRKELNYLQRQSKLSKTQQEQEESLTKSTSCASPIKDEDHSVSWVKLAKDPNIWAIIAVKFTLRWYFSVFASLMPTYLSSVTHMTVETIGNMSVFQSTIGLVSGILMSYLTKSIIMRRPFNLSLAAFRKTFQSIVNFGLALCLTVFILFDCNQWVTIVALTISGICINFYVAAALQLPLDLSPNHCGLITSISNTLALGQALGAPISGLILDNGPKDRTLWRIVWGLAILLNAFSGLMFIILVDSRPRDYSKKISTTSRQGHKNDLDVTSDQLKEGS